MLAQYVYGRSVTTAQHVALQLNLASFVCNHHVQIVKKKKYMHARVCMQSDSTGGDQSMNKWNKLEWHNQHHHVSQPYDIDMPGETLLAWGQQTHTS